MEAELLDLRAPGIERKNSQTNLFDSDSFQTFGGDYEEKKLMANKGNNWCLINTGIQRKAVVPLIWNWLKSEQYSWQILIN